MLVTNILPHSALRPHVVRYLALDANVPSPLEQCLAPAGGPVLTVLVEGVQRAGMHHATLDSMPPAYLIGHLTSAARIGFAGRVRSFMVQFTATGIYSLFGLSIRELADQWVEVGALSDPELRGWAHMLIDAPDDRSRATASDEVLLRRLVASPRDKNSDRALATATAACQLIEEAEGCIRVEALAAQLYTTPRTLRRHFEEAVGISVRSATRVSRFLSARRYLDRNPAASWSEVVFRFGYSDQSHLIRDFQRYCGEPPSVFRARRNDVRLLTLVGQDAGPEPGSVEAEPDA